MFSLDREKKQTLHMLNTYHPCQWRIKRQLFSFQNMDVFGPKK
jgi:hypothetical protein